MRSLLFKGAVCVVLVGLLTVASTAQLTGTYTIDPAGTGTKNFKTFALASAALAAGVGTGGVTFVVAPVTFNEAVTFNAVTGASAANRVTVICTASKKALVTTTATSTYALTLSSAKFYHIEGIQFDSSYRSLYCSQADDNRFVNCKFSSGNYVVYSQGMDRTIFDSCEVDGKGVASRLLAPYNANDSDSRFQNCFFHSCSPTGLGVYLNVSGYGIMFWNNTVLVTTSSAAVHLGGCCAWSRANSFRNNIVVNLGTGVAIKYGYRSPLLDYNDADYNCYWAPKGNACELENGTGFTKGTLAAWKKYFNANRSTLVPQTGGTPWPTVAQARFDDNSIEADPLLMSMTGPYDIHLKPGSPCMDAGTNVWVAGAWISYSATASVATDFEGEKRTTPIDIGADEVAVKITGAGSGARGTALVFTLFSGSDATRTYQVGSSLGAGPIPIDTRKLGLTPDNLLVASTSGLLPGVFANYGGFLDSKGMGTATLNIPAIAALKGVRIYTAFLTIDQKAPSGVSNISNTFLFTIQ